MYPGQPPAKDFEGFDDYLSGLPPLVDMPAWANADQDVLEAYREYDIRNYESFLGKDVADSKFTKGITERDLPYMEEIQGRRMGSWDMLKNGTMQFMGNLLADTVIGVGELSETVWGKTGLKDTALGRVPYMMTTGLVEEVAKHFADPQEHFYQSALASLGQDLKDKLLEEFPIYRTAASTGFSPGNSLWWSALLPQLASTIALMIPGRFAMKLGEKALQQTAKMFSSGAMRSTGTTAKLLSFFSNQGVQLTGGALAGAVTSREVESMMEANEVYHSIKDMLMSKGIDPQEAERQAREAGQSAYKLNWANLSMDFMQYMFLGKMGSLLAKSGAVPWGRLAGYVGLEVGQEAIEEGYQYIIGAELMRKAKLDNELMWDDTPDFMSRLGKYMKDGDFQTSAFMGALGGGLFSAIGVPGTARAARRQQADLNEFRTAMAPKYKMIYAMMTDNNPLARQESDKEFAVLLQRAFERGHFGQVLEDIKQMASHPDRVFKPGEVSVTEEIKEKIESGEMRKEMSKRYEQMARLRKTYNKIKNDGRLNAQGKTAMFLLESEDLLMRDRHGVLAADREAAMQSLREAYQDPKVAEYLSAYSRILSMEKQKDNRYRAGIKELREQRNALAAEIEQASPGTIQALDEQIKARTEEILAGEYFNIEPMEQLFLIDKGMLDEQKDMDKISRVRGQLHSERGLDNFIKKAVAEYEAKLAAMKAVQEALDKAQQAKVDANERRQKAKDKVKEHAADPASEHKEAMMEDGEDVASGIADEMANEGVGDVFGQAEEVFGESFADPAAEESSEVAEVVGSIDFHGLPDADVVLEVMKTMPPDASTEEVMSVIEEAFKDQGNIPDFFGRQDGLREAVEAMHNDPAAGMALDAARAAAEQEATDAHEGDVGAQENKEEAGEPTNLTKDELEELQRRTRQETPDGGNVIFDGHKAIEAGTMIARSALPYAYKVVQGQAVERLQKITTAWMFNKDHQTRMSEPMFAKEGSRLRLSVDRSYRGEIVIAQRTLTGEIAFDGQTVAKETILIKDQKDFDRVFGKGADLDVANVPIKVEVEYNGKWEPLHHLPTNEWLTRYTEVSGLRSYENIPDAEEHMIDSISEIKAKGSIEKAFPKEISGNADRQIAANLAMREKIAKAGTWESTVGGKGPGMLMLAPGYKFNYVSSNMGAGGTPFGNITYAMLDQNHKLRTSTGNIFSGEILGADKLGLNERPPGTLWMLLESAAPNRYYAVPAVTPQLAGRPGTEFSEGARIVQTIYNAIHLHYSKEVKGRAEAVKQIAQTTGMDISTAKGLTEFLGQYIYVGKPAYEKTQTSNRPRLSIPLQAEGKFAVVRLTGPDVPNQGMVTITKANWAKKIEGGYSVRDLIKEFASTLLIRPDLAKVNTAEAYSNVHISISPEGAAVEVEEHANYNEWLGKNVLTYAKGIENPNAAGEGIFVVNPVITVAKEGAVAEETDVVSEAEYQEFVDSGTVTPQRLSTIVDKITKGTPLSLREQAMHNDKVSEINEELRRKKETDKFSDVSTETLEEFAEKVDSALRNEINDFRKEAKEDIESYVYASGTFWGSILRFHKDNPNQTEQKKLTDFETKEALIAEIDRIYDAELAALDGKPGSIVADTKGEPTADELNELFDGLDDIPINPNLPFTELQEADAPWLYAGAVVYHPETKKPIPSGQVNEHIATVGSILLGHILDMTERTEKKTAEVPGAFIYAFNQLQQRRNILQRVLDMGWLQNPATQGQIQRKYGLTIPDEASAIRLIGSYDTLLDPGVWENLKGQVVNALQADGIQVKGVKLANIEVQEPIEGQEEVEGSAGQYFRTSYDSGAVFYLNPLDKTSWQVKALLRSIPSGKVTHLGTAMPIDHLSTYEELLHLLADRDVLLTWEVAKRAMMEEIEYHPYYQAIIDKLEVMPAVRQMFLRAMNNSHYEFLIMHLTNDAHKIFPANRNSVTSKMKNRWRSNQRLMNIALTARDLATGEIVIDQAQALAIYESFLALQGVAEVQDLQTTTETLSELLHSIGIDIRPHILTRMAARPFGSKNNEKTLVEHITDDRRGIFHNIFSALGPHTLELDPDGSVAATRPIDRNNPMKLNPGDIGQLAIALYPLSPKAHTSSFWNSNGRMAFNFSMPTFATARMRQLLHDPAYVLALVGDKKGKGGLPFNKGSAWLREFRDNPEFMKQHFGISMLDALRVGDKYKSAAEKLSPTALELLSLMAFQDISSYTTRTGVKVLQPAYFIYPTIADKGRVGIAKAPIIDDTRIIFSEDGSYTLSDVTINTVAEQVIAEAKRVAIAQTTTKPKMKEQGLEGTAYYKGADKFILFRHLNNHTLKILAPDLHGAIWRDGRVHVDATAIKAIRELTKRNLYQRIDERLAHWEQIGIDVNTMNGAYMDYYAKSYEQEQGLIFAAAHYEINHSAAYNELLMSMSGDPAQEYKGAEVLNNAEQELAAIGATMENVTKRMAKDWAPGMTQVYASEDQDASDSNVNYTILADSFDRPYIDVLRDRMGARADKLGVSENVMNALSDAYEMITLREFMREQLHAGFVSKEVHDEVVSHIRDGQDYSLGDKALQEVLTAMVKRLGPEKPVYVGTRINEDLGLDEQLYVKSATMPLVPDLMRLANGQKLELDNLRVAMELPDPSNPTQRIHRAPFATAVKLHTAKTVSINNGAGGIKSVAELRQDLLGAVISFPRSGLREQQSLPWHKETSASYPTQMGKNLFDGVLAAKGFRGDPTLTGRALWDEKDSVQVKRIQIAAARIQSSLKMQDGHVGDMKALFNRLMKQVRSTPGFSENQVELLRLTEEAEAVFGSNLEAEYPMLYQSSGTRLVSLVANILTEDVLQRAMHGRSYVQSPALGMRPITIGENKELSGYRDGIVTVGDYEGGDLLGMRLDENDKVLPMQVIVPWAFVDKGGNPLPIEPYLEENGKLRTDPSSGKPYIDKAVLRQIAARIPNQGHNSMALAEVVGFTNAKYGDFMFVPEGVTAQMGSDFDVDKLYSHHTRYLTQDSENPDIAPNLVVVSLGDLTFEDVTGLKQFAAFGQDAGAKKFSTIIDLHGWGFVREKIREYLKSRAANIRQRSFKEVEELQKQIAEELKTDVTPRKLGQYLRALKEERAAYAPGVIQDIFDEYERFLTVSPEALESVGIDPDAFDALSPAKQQKTLRDLKAEYAGQFTSLEAQIKKVVALLKEKKNVEENIDRRALSIIDPDIKGSVAAVRRSAYRHLSIYEHELEQKLFDITWDVLSHPDVFKRVINPLGYGELSDIAEASKRREAQRLASSPENMQELLGIHQGWSSINLQANQFQAGAIGADGISAWSSAKSALSVIQHVKEPMEPQVIIMVPNKRGEMVPRRVPVQFHYKYGGEVYNSTALNNALSADKSFKSDHVTPFQSLSVDNGKMNGLGAINHTLDTMRVLIGLVAMGMPHKLAAYITMQPAIRKIAKALEERRSPLAAYETWEPLDVRATKMEKQYINQEATGNQVPDMDMMEKIALSIEVSPGVYEFEGQVLPQEAVDNAQVDALRLVQAGHLGGSQLMGITGSLSYDSQGVGGTLQKILTKARSVENITGEKNASGEPIISNAQKVLVNGKGHSEWGAYIEYGLRPVQRVLRQLYGVGTGPWDSVFDIIAGHSEQVSEDNVGKIDRYKDDLKIRSIVRGMQAFVHTAPIDGLFDSAHAERKRLLIGEESIVKQYMDLLAHPDLVDNLFFNALEANVSENGDRVPTIRFSGGATVYDKRAMAMSYKNMLVHPDPIIRKFAHDLFRYQMVTGPTSGAGKFTDHIPVNAMRHTRWNILEVLRANQVRKWTPMQIMNFTRQYFQHNPADALRVSLGTRVGDIGNIRIDPNKIRYIQPQYTPYVMTDTGVPKPAKFISIKEYIKNDFGITVTEVVSLWERTKTADNSYVYRELPKLGDEMHTEYDMGSNSTVTSVINQRLPRTKRPTGSIPDVTSIEGLEDFSVDMIAEIHGIISAQDSQLGSIDPSTQEQPILRHSAQYNKYFQGNSIHSALDTIIGDAASDFNAALAHYLKQIVPDSTAIAEDINLKDPGIYRYDESTQDGVFVFNFHHKYFKKFKGDALQAAVQEVILHEIVHRLTSQQVIANPEFRSKIALLQAAVRDSPLGSNVGKIFLEPTIKGIAEFLSAGMSNAEFAQLIGQVQYGDGGRTVLQKLADFVLEFIETALNLVPGSLRNSVLTEMIGVVSAYNTPAPSGTALQHHKLFNVQPNKAPDMVKAPLKASLATKYIGYGTGSTGMYRNQAGPAFANTGQYNSSDVVFISINGKVSEENFAQTFEEATRALQAGATLLTDSESYLAKSTYNQGERLLREGLLNYGAQYSEHTENGTTIGVWKMPETAPKSIVAPSTETDYVYGSPLFYEEADLSAILSGKIMDELGNTESDIRIEKQKDRALRIGVGRVLRDSMIENRTLIQSKATGQLYIFAEADTAGDLRGEEALAYYEDNLNPDDFFLYTFYPVTLNSQGEVIGDDIDVIPPLFNVSEQRFFQQYSIVGEVNSTKTKSIVAPSTETDFLEMAQGLTRDMLEDDMPGVSAHDTGNDMSEMGSHPGDDSSPTHLPPRPDRPTVAVSGEARPRTIPTTRSIQQPPAIPGKSISGIDVWSTGSNGHFSNFAPRQFTARVAGVERVWPTVEHAYQAAKAAFAANNGGTKGALEAILKSADRALAAKTKDAVVKEARIAKAEGGKIAVWKNPSWMSNRYDIITDLMYNSFKSNLDAAGSLVATGKATFTHNRSTTDWATLFPDALTEVRRRLNEAGITEFTFPLIEDELNNIPIDQIYEMINQEMEMSNMFENEENPLHRRILQSLSRRLVEARRSATHSTRQSERVGLELRAQSLARQIIGFRRAQNDDALYEMFQDHREYASKLVMSSELSAGEIRHAINLMDTWRKVDEHLPQLERDTTKVSQRIIGMVKGEAEVAYNALYRTMTNFALEHFQEIYSNPLTNTMLEAEADVSSIFAGARDISKQRRPISDLFAISLQTAARQVNVGLEEALTDIAAMFDAIEKHPLYKEHGDKLFLQKDAEGEPTGLFLTRHSHQWNKTLKSYTDQLSKVIRQKDPNAIQKANDELSSFIQRSTVVFNPVVLFGEVTPARAKLLEEIYFQFGKEHGDRLIAQAKDKYNAFIEAAKQYREGLEAQVRANMITPEEATDALESWRNVNDPVRALELFEESTYVSMTESFRYLYYEPKTKQYNKPNDTWVPTEWYDENYKTIMADETLAEFYDMYTTFLEAMMRYLPIDAVAGYGEGFLPEVQKTLMDTMGSEGFRAAWAKLLEDTVENLTTYSQEDLVGGKVDPITKKPDRRIPIMFVNTELKAEERSYNLRRLAELFAGMALNYKYKSMVEDEVMLLDRIAANMQGLRKGKSGVVEKTGELPRNLYRQIEFAVDSMLYGKRRTRENPWKIWTYYKGKRVDSDNSDILTLAESMRKDGMTEEQIYEQLKDNALNEGEYIRLEKKKVLAAELKKKMRELGAQLAKDEIGYEAYHAQMRGLQNSMADLEGRSVIPSKVGDALLHWTQLRGMGWNFFAAGANLGFGVMGNMVHAGLDKEFGYTELMQAMPIMLHAVTPGKPRTEVGHKMEAIFRRYNLLHEVNEAAYGRNKTHMKRTNWWGKLYPYEMQRGSEFTVQGMTLVAMMLRQKLELADGNTISLFEATAKDGRLRDDLDYKDKAKVLKEWNGSPEEAGALLKFINKSSQVIHSIHGNYDPNAPITWKTTFAGRAALQFRTWALEGFASRVEPRGYDPYMERDVKGRWVTYAELGIKDSFATIFKMIIRSKSKYSAIGKRGMTDLDIANMRANLTEIAWAMALGGMYLFLRALGGADDEKNPAIILLMNQIHRVEQDIYFYMNPGTFMEIARNPAAVLGLLGDAGKAVNGLYRILVDDNYDGHQFGTDILRITPGGALYPRLKSATTILY